MYQLIKQAITLGILAIFLFALQLFAFIEPSSSPPGGNVSAPLNTGNIGQTKAGGLILNTGGATYGLIVQNGFVGIGTASPNGKLHVTGGNSIFDGNVGIGTVNPGEKLDVQGGRVKIKSVVLDAVTGSNPSCPVGGFLTKKWSPKTCVDDSAHSACTTSAGWSTTPPQCGYTTQSTCGPEGAYCFVSSTCTADSWTEAICAGN